MRRRVNTPSALVTAVIRLVNISAFGGWAKAQAEFFADGALFDQLYE